MSLLKSLSNLLRSWRISPALASSSSRGMSEFFDNSNSGLKKSAGRSWKASELRLKSFEDLHKLWYVLLKEYNMLSTMQHDAKRNHSEIDESSRIDKVKKSMFLVKVVLKERQTALTDYRISLEKASVARKEKIQRDEEKGLVPEVGATK